MKKVLCPTEIAELKKGQVANATIFVLFASASNREGDMVARLDIKTSIGGTPVDLKPSLGDLLLPPKSQTVTEFDASMQKMQGFQRVTTKFRTTELMAVPMRIMKSAALSPVGKLSWVDNKLRFMGGLPASSDTVCVRLECDPKSGSGTITVCCDHAVAVNNITNLLKHAVSSS